MTVSLWFQISIMELEIRVTPDEERAFAVQTNFQWPRLGMCCAVSNCPDFSLFSTYAKYVDHFAAAHRDFKIMYKCSLCAKLVGKHNKLSHKKSHKCNVKSITYEHVKVTNPNYIDPGNVLIPLPPSSSCRAVDVESDPCFTQYKRQELCKKRREYTIFNSTQQSQAEIMDNFEKI